MSVWHAVVGYEGLYEVSDAGAVRSLDRVVRQPNGGVRLQPAKPMRISTNPKGYPQLSLTKDGVGAKFSVHRLVLEAFVGLRPAGMECLHGDGVKTNNTLANIRWGTNPENVADKQMHGTQVRGEKCARAKLTPQRIEHLCELRAAGHTTRAIGALMDIAGSTVSKILLGRRWQHLQRVA